MQVNKVFTEPKKIEVEIGLTGKGLSLRSNDEYCELRSALENRCTDQSN